MAVDEKQHWHRISALFDRALDLPEADRIAFVLAESDADPAIRDEVIGLLCAAEQTPACLDEKAVNLVPTAVLESLAEPSEPEDESGRMIGPYRLSRLIGRGGMGAVYAAERGDGQFHQQVALKLLPIHGGGRIRERLLAERQVLAGLSHPSIARLLDGGVSEDGRPYFVMEYVDGQPIDVFCLNPGVSIEDRLELVIAVCEAIHSAHQSLVVHRDLKPSNILVLDARSSGDVRVKLLDFGIAKVLSETDSDIDSSLRTRTGERWMTPSYAAPEQVTGKPTTTATDVYQLGVLLHEVLTGVRPFDGADSGAFELQRAICDEPPTPPSRTTQRLRTGSRAARRAIDSGMIRGDLDAIVLRALRKEPAARYSSAEAMAEDLRRFLRKEPVLARHGSARYRMLRFISRNRTVVTIAAIATAAVIASSVIYAHNLSQARAEAEAAARTAEAEAENRAEIANFLINVFTEADPTSREGQIVTVDDVLERAADQVLSALDEVDSRQLEFLRVIGQVQIARGEYEAAERLLFEAQERLAGLDRPLELARVQISMVYLLREQRQFARAEPLLVKALPVLRDHMERDAVDILQAELLYVNILIGLDRLDAADSLLQQVLSLIGASPNRERVLLHALGTLGILRRAQGRYADAASANHDLIALLEKRGEGETSDAGTTWNNLGFALRQQQDWVGAAAAYRRALSIVAKIYGEAHPYNLISLSNLASVYSSQGWHDQAIEILEQRLALTRKSYESEHWRVGVALSGLAQAYLDAGDAETAAPLFQEAVGIWEEVLGGDHVWTKAGRMLLAAALQIGGYADEARETRRSGLAFDDVALLDSNSRSWLQWVVKTYQNHGNEVLADSYQRLLDGNAVDGSGASAPEGRSR